MISSYRHLFSSYLDDRHIKKKLAEIDDAISYTQPQDIPDLFKDISIESFGELLLDVPPAYPSIKAFFPSMASAEDQNLWTGNHGKVLLNQSLAFMKSMLVGYYEITGKDIKNAKVLDFGFGWGRLIRLLYKFVSYEQIFGIDPWENSIDICRKHGVKAHLAVSDYVPYTIPFDIQFDLIFAFSVFTHLSEKTCTVSLTTLRRYISNDGLLVITIRPRDYWLIHEKGKISSEMFALHDKTGFAFNPHKLPPIDGDITYGDTSISIDYFKRNFTSWEIVKTVLNEEDSHQLLLFLRPT